MKHQQIRNGKVSIGIDLGGTNIKAALIDDQTGILEKKAIPTEAEGGLNHVFERIASVVKELSKAFPGSILGVGMGSPGVVSADRTTVYNPPNLPGWEAVHVTEEITKRTGMPCIVENDANLAALGSSRFGVGKQFDSFIILTLGTGVGGGIIYNRSLFRGQNGSAGELGHVTINYRGPTSNSNTRGGIEAYLGQRFLSRYAIKRLRSHKENPLYKKFQDKLEELEPLDLYHAAEEGNTLAVEILHKTGEKLGYALVNYIHVLDIRKVVISGGVANAGHWLTDPARETALTHLMPPFHHGFEILYEPLGNDAALYGASVLAREHL